MSCGNPPAVVNGLVELVNGTTAWQVNLIMIIINMIINWNVGVISSMIINVILVLILII